MTSSEDSTPRFAAELSTALARSGMSLQHVVDILAERGLPTTQASLSYWKSGRSLPRRASSKPIIIELERIFDLPEGTLIDALEHSLQAQGAAKQARRLTPLSGSAPYRIGFEESDRWEDLDAKIDWNADVRREVVEDTTTIRADRLGATHKIDYVVRVPNTPRAHLHVGIALHDWDLLPDGEIVAPYDIEGAHPEHAYVSQNGRNAVIRLVLPENLKPGELHRLSLAYDFETTKPIHEVSERSFPWPLRFYNSRVIFEGEPPQEVYYDQRHIDQQGQVTRRIVSSMQIPVFDNSVQISLENVRPCYGLFRW